MLDARVYRAAFLPLVLALFVVAFALERRPPPATTLLAADAFNAERSFGAASPPPADSLRELAATFPDRRPGSAGDSGLADRVAKALQTNGFDVSRRSSNGRPVGGTASSETVVGIRPGISNRRIVVIADRAAKGSPAVAQLSGTAALLELARVFRSADAGPRRPEGEAVRAVGRDLRRTLVLVSTSGAALGGGAPGARAILAEAGPREAVDAVLVLGDLAGGRVRKPWVVPWSNGASMAPVGLRRTVEVAVRAEVGSQPGGARAAAQWIRRAFPLTVSAQGESAALGMPAVLLAVSGERGPSPRTEVTAERLGEFGRGALRAVSAVDEVGGVTGGLARRRTAGAGPAAFGRETRGIVTLKRVLPDWAVRLLAGTALLPALLAALDGFFRVRRRRLPVERRLGWVAAGGVPFLLVYAWLRVLGATGAIDAPPAPVLPSSVPVEAGAIVALVSAALVLGLTWVVSRRMLGERLGGQRAAADGAAAAAAGLGLVIVVGLVWIRNPYAAALLIPAAHLWLLVGAGWAGRRSQRFPSSWPAGVALALGLALPGLAVLHYAVAFDLGPAETAWFAVLITAGGQVTPATALVLSVVLGCLTSVLRVISARGPVTHTSAPPPDDGRPVGRVRGPGGHAGPGSLGGTESALRR